MKRHLSDKVQLGAIQLKNRIVMSAMTRRRTDLKTGVPNDLMAQYYTQRAGAGLILTECASVSPRGDAFPGAGNLFNKEQAEGWHRVVQSVHKAGGRIFLQLFHGGRNLHSSFINGLKPWAPSAIAIRNKIPGYGDLAFEVPHSITLEEIEILKQEFSNSFKLANQVGFDGVEIHSANGYILDQFLRSGANNRTDRYGGSAENRSRLALQVVDLAVKELGKDRVGIKFSPVSRYGDMFDANPLQTYSHILKELDKRKIGFVQLVTSQGEAPAYGYTSPTEQMPDVLQALRPYFSGTLIGNQGFNKENALQAVQKGHADLISFGRSYIVNPDFAERVLNDQPIETKLDFSTFYLGGAKGYTDWPFYQSASKL